MNWNHRRLYIVRAYHESRGYMVLARTLSPETAVLHIRVVKNSRPNWDVWIERAYCG